tara:strand:- start:294 stop:776 length:483 start_codon:yes stop_codon:yes gene_type:complete
MPLMSRRKEYIGIDPGVGGGIAIAWGQDNIHQYKMPPTEREICDVFNGSMCDLVYSVAVIEKVHSMPKQGVASTFKFGMNYGFLRGCLIAAGIPFEEVTPRAWQKALGIPPKKKTESNTEWKNRLKGMAQQLFPQLKVTLATADALLIATYCKRKHEGTL